MPNLIIQKDGQTIAVNPRKLNFIVNGADLTVVESPPKVARIDVTAHPGVSDLFLLSPNGGETFLYFPSYTSSLSLIGPTSGSVYNQYHPLTIQWSKQYLTYADVYYSINGGGTWIQLVSASMDTSFSWNAPAVGSNTAINIKILGNGIEVDTSITDQFTSLTLINPSGSSQTYASGSVIPISWSQINTPAASLDYSLDQVTWTPIVSDVVGTSYNWTYGVPAVTGSKIYIKVKEYPTPYISNINYFTDNSSPIPLNGLVLWMDASTSSSYTKDGSNNITALTDLSPNHTALTINATKLVWYASQKNSLPAYYSNGASNIAILTNYTIQNNSISVFYIAKDIATQNQSYENLICIDDGALNEFYKFVAGINHGGTSTGNFAGVFGNGSTFGGTSAIVVPYSTWAIYGITNNGTATIYYNSPIAGGSGSMSSYISSGPLKVITSVYRPFLGYFGEMVVYNRVLSYNEIKSVEKYLRDKWCLLCWFKFENNCNDSSNNNHSGTPTNITYATGKVGMAASFDGSSSKVQLNPLSVSGGVFTFSCWINLSSVTGIHAISQDWSVAYRNYIIQINGSTFETITGNGAGLQDATLDGGTISLGVWTHVCFVRNGVNHLMYVNGVLVAQQTGSYSGATTSNTTNIGVSGFNDSWFAGLIDEVIIEDAPWSADDVLDYYNSTK